MKPPSRVIGEGASNLFCLLSLSEIMVKFKCEMIVRLVSFLKEIEGIYTSMRVASHAANRVNKTIALAVHEETIPEELRARCVENLAWGRRAFLDLELHASTDRCGRFEECLKGNPSFRDLEFEAKAMLQAIDGDLSRRYFGFIPSEKAKSIVFYEQDWATVLKRFPEVAHDVTETAHCYSLARNAACIFHSMKIAEVGLRTLAKTFRPKITLRRHIDHSDWGEILKKFKEKTEAAQQRPRSSARQKSLEFFSKAADKCDFMNNVWRRENSHARLGKGYPDIEALQVMTYTREFMEMLAKKWPK